MSLSNTAKLLTVRAFIAFPVEMPGVHFVTCPSGAKLSINGCSARHAIAVSNKDPERCTSECKTCPVGGVLWRNAPTLEAHTIPDCNGICPRCGRVGQRLIGPGKAEEALCVSCWNRKREEEKGCNARGHVPEPLIISNWLIGVEIDGEQRYRRHSGAHQGEAIIRCALALPGVRFHDSRPGSVAHGDDGFTYRCNKHPEERLREETGKRGAVAFVCPVCGPEAAALPVPTVLQALELRTVGEAAAVYSAIRPDKCSEIHTASICSGCRQSTIKIRRSSGRTVATCHGCGATETHLDEPVPILSPEEPHSNSISPQARWKAKAAQHRAKEMADARAGRLPAHTVYREKPERASIQGTGSARALPLTLHRIPQLPITPVRVCVLAALGDWHQLDGFAMDTDRGDGRALSELREALRALRLS